ncbi:MAG: pro-sigmaK processing inhibitor BofA family protein [Firmicutes bacterium]|nr:pro-sigmaK processing inhibitor BofA family protein [Bacillota bacterium]
MPQIPIWVWIVAGALALVGIGLPKVAKHLLRAIGWVAFSGVFGAAVLFAVNWIGQSFHFAIPVNTVTALLSGILGVPGIALLAVTKWLLL